VARGCTINARTNDGNTALGIVTQRIAGVFAHKIA
jgi:hypothetical protein